MRKILDVIYLNRIEIVLKKNNINFTNLEIAYYGDERDMIKECKSIKVFKNKCKYQLSIEKNSMAKFFRIASISIEYIGVKNGCEPVMSEIIIHERHLPIYQDYFQLTEIYNNISGFIKNFVVEGKKYWNLEKHGKFVDPKKEEKIIRSLAILGLLKNKKAENMLFSYAPSGAMNSEYISFICRRYNFTKKYLEIKYYIPINNHLTTVKASLVVLY